MAPGIRKALGTVKDQTSIGLAKVSSNIAPELDVAIVKATSHDDEPASEKHLREILNLTSYSRGYVSACIATVSRRLGKTRDWVVALKALVLVHRLLTDGDAAFQHEILYATRRGTRLLNMSDFRDEAHSNSWDHSAFVRTYAAYLDQRLEYMMYERKQGGGISRTNEFGTDRQSRSEYGDHDPYAYGSYGRSSYSSSPRNGRDTYEEHGEEKKPSTPLRDMKPERLLSKMQHSQQLLDRVLACRPTGNAKHSRMILVALYPIVRESFQLYADICEILAILLDRFFDMEYPDCIKSFEAYASAAKQIDALCAFYAWCKDTGVARSSEYPEVQRITDKLLETLEVFVRDRGRKPRSPPRVAVTAPAVVVEAEQDLNSIKALPAPSDYKDEEPEPANPIVEPVKQQPPPQQPDLVDLREDGVTADDQSNTLALALFQAPVAANGANGSWEAFPSTDGDSGVSSAWQNPAAETGKADWELTLVETASNLSKQKAMMAGGLDPLLLNGMYDQGTVKQQVNAQVSSGSSSSVALPAPGRGTAPVLALPAPNGTMQTVGQDPFTASLGVPPPSYVQMAEIEKKQHLLVQEQVMWHQYANNGMQGQTSLAKLSNNTMPNSVVMPYGMPPAAYNAAAGGYYYPNY
ncbi:probable clathrin assembly protein At4g32285 [Zingiber officinale]|uniref:ENTH domain-containing protein n=1 Tax=Zingiber officinale TaxID=94328 RepID=A0A8J5FBJ5_ZINOF|nr:probable clathrin assembly protein At4g32285 [Zingiber officinale]XP_042427165.1 probable clathrin assembly protein At4g32285 [Zingiber officinale]KAG6482031.1 hypothetical protein ZIOFF_058658 [Zingiber officinale]